MGENNRIRNCILCFLSLMIIFIISGIYSNPEYLILLSFFVPVAFIPLLLLIAYKGVYNRINSIFYLLAIISSFIFFRSLIYFRTPSSLNSPTINGTYTAILIFAFFLSFMINAYSYRLIRFFGIRIDNEIVKNVKTISCTCQNDEEKIKNLIKFFLTNILSFENVTHKSSNLDMFKRGDDEYVRIVYSENKNSSNLLISYIMFYNSQDGIRAFDSGSINSFSIILEKLVGGTIVATPEEVINGFHWSSVKEFCS